MSEEELSRSGRGCLPKVLWTLAILVVAFLFLMAAVRNAWILELPYHLIAGCVLHGNRAVSHFAADLPRLMMAAIFPLVATTIALWGAHRLILWWRLANENKTGWHFKHTALAGSLVLLGAAAAIALSGILHEAAWLPQGKVIQSNRRTTLTVAVSNARQLGLMLFEYETENGTYPSSLLDLEKLATDSVSLRRMMFVDLDTPGPPEPFVLLKGGVATGIIPSGIVMIGPQMPENGDFVVLKADNSVTRLPAAKFIEVVRSAARKEPAGQ